jgi:hypothetical protein
MRGESDADLFFGLTQADRLALIGRANPQDVQAEPTGESPACINIRNAPARLTKTKCLMS